MAVPMQPDVLPDVLGSGLSIVFCGSAAGAASARAGAYYAGPGNRFWPTLYRVGLTPRILAPADFRTVRRYGIGLTDLCKTESGSDVRPIGPGRRHGGARREDRPVSAGCPGFQRQAGGGRLSR